MRILCSIVTFIFFLGKCTEFLNLVRIGEILRGMKASPSLKKINFMQPFWLIMCHIYREKLK